MDSTPSEIGARAECQVAYALMSAGWAVYVPLFSSHGRVDLVALRDNVISRIQCKSARVSGRILEFRTCSHTGNQPKSYEGEVDAFGVYSPELGATFLVPIDGLGGRGCYLRLGPTANNQSKGVRYAADYAVGRFAP